MNYSFVLSCLLLFMVQLNALAQKQHQISVDMVKNTITINGVLFTDTSSIESYERLLGQADRIVQKRGADQFYAYDKLGISLSLKEETLIVNEIFITYLQDEDEKAAKGVYKGLLMVNNQVVNGQVSQEKMSKFANVELVEVMNGYFITPKRNLNLLLHYPQDMPYTNLKKLGLNFARMN